tara:strand:+ start:262 stop:534 length:273 start_codon:yes stop_codon:yes gene_type:complete
MSKKPKQYCGYEDSPEWTRKLMSGKFNTSCRIHDLDYGEKTPFSRSKADVRFRNHMLKQAKRSPFWITMAYIYYLGVIWGGKKAYLGKSK